METGNDPVLASKERTALTRTVPSTPHGESDGSRESDEEGTVEALPQPEEVEELEPEFVEQPLVTSQS
jgi:hypothetical protein